MNIIKKIIVGVVVVVVVFVAYSYLTKDPSENPGSALGTQRRVADFKDAKEILALLNRMSKVKLDNSIFSNQVFLGLKDTTAVLVSQPKYRNNPFAPLGTDDNSLESTMPIE